MASTEVEAYTHHGGGCLAKLFPASSANQLAPQAQFRPRAVSLRLPPDFNWIGPAACELCKRLQLVDLSRTNISEILGSTFAHCSQLERLSLVKKLRRIGREAFLNCTSLREINTPPALMYVARRAFAGCTQLCALHKPEAKTTWRGPYAESSAFDKCSQLNIPGWVHLLPPNRSNRSEEWADDFYEELRKDLQ